MSGHGLIRWEKWYLILQTIWKVVQVDYLAEICQISKRGIGVKVPLYGIGHIFLVLLAVLHLKLLSNIFNSKILRIKKLTLLNLISTLWREVVLRFGLINERNYSKWVSKVFKRDKEDIMCPHTFLYLNKISKEIVWIKI